MSRTRLVLEVVSAGPAASIDLALKTLELLLHLETLFAHLSIFRVKESIDSHLYCQGTI